MSTIGSSVTASVVAAIIVALIFERKKREEFAEFLKDGWGAVRKVWDFIRGLF
jgi:hypothetical protein